MANESSVDPILGNMATKTAKQMRFEQRLAEKVRQVEAGPAQLLLQICGLRKQQYANFWNDTNGVSPVAVVANLGLEKAKALFSHDADLATFLAGKLAESNVAPEVIEDMVPGVPDNFVVDYEATAAEDFIKPRTK